MSTSWAQVQAMPGAIPEVLDVSIDFSKFNQPYPHSPSSPGGRSYRDILTQILSSIDQAGDQVESSSLDLLPSVSRLFRSYRTGLSGQSSRSSGPSIQQAPYVGLLLGQKIADLYAPAYDSAYRQNYESIVDQVSAEALMDGFLQLVAVGETPPGLEKISKRIGKCLAGQVLAGKSPYCPISREDGTPVLKSPGLIKLLWTKMSCRRNSRGSDREHRDWRGKDRAQACKARKLVYASAYKTLKEKRKDPKVLELIRAKFNTEFPKAFRDQFLTQLSDHYQNLPLLISSKLGGVVDPLWSSDVQLLEAPSRAVTQASGLPLREFAVGLNNDARAAAVLLRAAKAGVERGELSPVQAAFVRGLAAPLFYAASNRLLVMTGGEEARWNQAGSHFVLVRDDEYDATQPKRPPQFELSAFGGWSARKDSAKPLSYENWDWSSYDPFQEAATSLRLFTREWWLGARAVPVLTGLEKGEQDLGDLVELMSGLVHFLNATAEGAVLRPFFGNNEELVDLLDGHKPVIFPVDGRELAIGVLAGVLKNLVVPGFGHLETMLESRAEDNPEESEPPPLGLRFYQKVGFAGRAAELADTQSLARFVSVATELRQWFLTDPAVPEALRAYMDQINGAIQTGALILGAQGQNADGSFGPGLPQVLDLTLDGMGALTDAYNLSKLMLLRVRLRAGWRALEQEWLRAGVLGIPPIEGWKWLALWSRTQEHVRVGLDGVFAPEIAWPVWDARMAELRARLVSTLKSERGPF